MIAKGRTRKRLSLTIVAIILFSSPALRSDAAAPAGAKCATELKWSSASNVSATTPQLICLQSSRGLIWQDPGNVKIDAHLNRIFTRCGSQIKAIDTESVDPNLLTSYKAAVTKYVNNVLHLKVVRVDTNSGFYSVNVKYYAQIGICSNGVGTTATYNGRDPRIPKNASQIWQGFIFCQIGPQTAPLSIAFAKVGTDWKFLALGPITAQSIYY